MTAAIDKCDCQMVAPASLAGNGSPTPRAASLLGDFFLVLLLGGLLLRRKPLLDRLRYPHIGQLLLQRGLVFDRQADSGRHFFDGLLQLLLMLARSDARRAFTFSCWAGVSESVEYVLSGGEPLLHPHALDFAEEAARAGNNVHLLTNGSLINNDDCAANRGNHKARQDQRRRQHGRYSLDKPRQRQLRKGHPSGGLPRAAWGQRVGSQYGHEEECP